MNKRTDSGRRDKIRLDLRQNVEASFFEWGGASLFLGREVQLLRPPLRFGNRLVERSQQLYQYLLEYSITTTHP